MRVARVSVELEVSDGAAPRAAAPPALLAFDDFFRSELPGVLALARALAGPASADDIAQEAMLVTYRRWGEVRSLENPAQWTRRVCANLAVSTFRRRLVELRAVTRLAARSEAVPETRSSEDFWRAVRALPRRQAQCAALRYVYEMSGPEIAGTLGISEGSVKVHLARARASLAAALDVAEGLEP